MSERIRDHAASHERALRYNTMLYVVFPLAINAILVTVGVVDLTLGIHTPLYVLLQHMFGLAASYAVAVLVDRALHGSPSAVVALWYLGVTAVRYLQGTLGDS